MILNNQAFNAGLASTSKSRSKSSVLNILFGLHAIWVERRRLAKLDAHRLADIGLSLEDAKDEARRAAWDAPQRWRR